ncbi:hypothetical protein SESBI_31118 [Sesbania bispinosa]|nr:hypothetical protein SESBI_31118 [Sesbania bispinosa]
MGNTGYHNSQGVAVNSDTNPFSKELVEIQQKLLQQSMQDQWKNFGTTTVTQIGNFLTALNASKWKTQSWIVDSRASNNMTGDIIVFDDYSPCQDHSTVPIEDGTFSKVIGIQLLSLGT